MRDKKLATIGAHAIANAGIGHRQQALARGDKFVAAHSAAVLKLHREARRIAQPAHGACELHQVQKPVVIEVGPGGAESLLQAGQGRSRALLVAGAPGVGKSALINALLSGADVVTASRIAGNDTTVWLERREAENRTSPEKSIS